MSDFYKMQMPDMTINLTKIEYIRHYPKPDRFWLSFGHVGEEIAISEFDYREIEKRLYNNHRDKKIPNDCPFLDVGALDPAGLERAVKAYLKVRKGHDEREFVTDIIRAYIGMEASK